MRGLGDLFSSGYRGFFVKSLGLSAFLGFVSVVLGLGLFTFFLKGQDVNFMAISFSFLIGGIFFIAASTYMDLKDYHYHSVILVGGLSAALTVVMSISLISTVFYAFSKGFGEFFVPALILAFAFSMIVGSSALWLLREENKKTATY